MMRVMWIDKDSIPKCLTLDKNMQNMKDVLTTSSTKLAYLVMKQNKNYEYLRIAIDKNCKAEL